MAMDLRASERTWIMSDDRENRQFPALVQVEHDGLVRQPINRFRSECHSDITGMALVPAVCVDADTFTFGPESCCCIATWMGVPYHSLSS